MKIPKFSNFAPLLAMSAFVAAFPASPAFSSPAQSYSAAVPVADEISGTVVDSEGEPVIGASIRCLDNQALSVSTDIDGCFRIRSSKPVNLEITYIGCQPKKVKAVPGEPLTIHLETESSLLDEVVVVGFATQKKVNLTGAVGTASAKDIKDRPVNNAVTALQGLIPGLNISNSSSGGELNANKSINIRGTATIGEGSNGSPLILIDGMEGDLNALNPQDIENISVLKDAAASSIYGSRAPFGVILVTTKSGSEGKTSIRYNNSFRFNQPLKIAKQMDSWHLANYLNDVTRYTSPGSFEYDEEELQKIYDYYTGASDVVSDFTGRWEANGSDQRHSVFGVDELHGVYANMNWMDEYYKKTAFSQEHNISISGGNSKINYYVSGNWMDMGGYMRYGEDDFQRFSFNGKVNATLYSWLKVGYTSRWTRNDYDRATAMNGGFYDNMMRRAHALCPKYDPNGYIFADYNYIEPLENGGRHKESKDAFTNQFQVTITPVKNWNIVAEFNARVNNDWTHEDSFPVYGHDAKDPNQLHIPVYYSGTNSSVYESSYRSTYLNTNVFTNYMLDLLEKNHFTFLLGTQIESFKQRNVYANRNDVTVNDLPVLDLTTSNEVYGLGGHYDDWRTTGFFARVNYDFDNKYLVEVNLRYDGSSRFRSDSRWVWSPSVSAGWNIDRESFWENIRQYVGAFKIRASYGQLANQNTSNWYPTYRVMGLSANDGGWLVNDDKTNKAWFPGLISTSLTWEKIRNTNIGVDVAAFNHRLEASFDYFWRDNKDMVGPGVSLPATLGTNPPAQNLLAMRTSGWELTLGWRQMIGDFNYNVKLNLSDDRTKITDYPNREGNLGKYIAGRYTGEIWGLETLGIARTQEEMDAHLANVDQSELNDGKWMAGDIMYVDTDGDGVIHKQSTINEKGDLRVIGNSSPRYRYGINLFAQWKGIDLSMFFQGVGKRDYYFSGYGDGGTGGKSAAFWGATVGGRSESLFFVEHLDYWRDDTSALGANYDAYYARPLYYTNKNRETQTRFLQDGSYVRLKNLQVGYTFPSEWMKKIHISNLRIYFSGENLWTHTKMIKVLDPESLEVSKMKSGGSYPLSRTYSFGLSVEF